MGHEIAAGLNLKFRADLLEFENLSPMTNNAFETPLAAAREDFLKSSGLEP